MKWISAKVTFDAPDRTLATDLVADVFYSLNLKGVVVDDPVQDLSQNWGSDAVPPPEKPGVTGYFADTPTAADQCRTLETKLARLEQALGMSTQISYSRIDEQDWAEAWKEYFWPEKITDRIVVKPTWRDYTAKPGEIVIEIDPGMAFGTGTHPSTSLCIRMIESYLQPGESFLDVGIGSGILSIAAAKLGAGEIIGVDNDDVAVSVAKKNLLINQIDKRSFTLFCGDLVDQVTQTVDILAANILAEVILLLLPDVSAVLKPGGLFIGSGIISEKKDAVLSCLKENGFIVVQDS
jgi:ribosomal protein L11 methyltransferase